MKKKKIFYFDTETTGTNPVDNDITQIAGLIEIDNKIIDKFDFRCRPLNWESVKKEALEVTGVSIEELMKFPDPMEIYSELTVLLNKYVDKYDKNDKMYFGGYNVRFDVDFLSEFFKKQNDPYFGSWFNWKLVDPLPILHYLDLTDKLSLPNYKLETVCGHFGIEIKAHDALSDIEATRKLWKKLIKLLKK